MERDSSIVRWARDASLMSSGLKFHTKKEARNKLSGMADLVAIIDNHMKKKN